MRRSGSTHLFTTATRELAGLRGLNQRLWAHMRVTRNDAGCRARSIRQWSRNDLCVERPSEIVRVEESSLLPRGSVTNVGDAIRAAGLAVATLIPIVNPLG